ncbi:RagB/SusD family nutrient uptake outer membrane protein [Cyclobacterium sediminis]
MKKTIYKFFLVATLGSTFSACNDDFLQRDPHTDITADQFFNTATDLETYTNGLYAQLRYSYEDLGTDNISLYTGSTETDQLLIGSLNEGNIGGWSDWSDLRRINYMLSRADRVQGDQAEINHYIGIARFFRAWYYFEKVKRYSDVPWYTIDLTDNAEELLYKTQDSRVDVMDKVLEDLNFAVANILPGSDKTKITNEAALLLLSRVSLFEGTFRKYHEELNLGATANDWLNVSMEASKKLIDAGSLEIYNTGNVAEDYSGIFRSADLSANHEMILYADADQKLGVGNNSHVVYNWQWSLSKNLVDSYLMTDGTFFSKVPGWDKKGFVEVFENRDPRMKATIAYPGFKTTDDGEPARTSPNFGGYMQAKFYPEEALRLGWNLNFTDLPIFRFAEALLNFAEAKAELGLLTQDDLNKSVNLLRARAGMPDMQMDKLSIDELIASRYPQIAGNAVLLEIRRERRVELACEGLRYQDILRWAAGEVYDGGQQGMYVPQLGAFDVTGDGLQDIAILEAPGMESPLDELSTEVKENLSMYYLKDENGSAQSFYLSEGDHGFINFTKNKNNVPQFIGPKYYYRPLPQQQLILNSNLVQNQFWK